jgi:NAD(P)H-nitrite reductase large subunit
MSDLRYTRHGAQRMAQRGFTCRSLEIVAMIGTEVEGGYLVREKDFQAYERNLKCQLDEARKLVGKRVVIDGDRVVTAYHAGEAKQRRLLRHVKDDAFVE